MRLTRAVLIVVVASACSQTAFDGPPRWTSFPTTTGAATAAAATSAASAAPSAATTPDVSAVKLVEFPVGRGQGPHDVAPAPDGGVQVEESRKYFGETESGRTG